MGNIIRRDDWALSLSPPEIWGEDLAPELGDLWLILRALFVLRSGNQGLYFDVLSHRSIQLTPYLDPEDVTPEEYELRVTQIVEWITECGGVYPIPKLGIPPAPDLPSVEGGDWIALMLQDIIRGEEPVFPWVPEPTPPEPTPPEPTPPES